MKSTVLSVASAMTLAAGAATAGGLDRSGTPIDIIFEKGNYAELSFGFAAPDVTGNDILGNSIPNIANDFAMVGAAVKMQFSDTFSVGVIFDQPYAADVSYSGNRLTTMLGGTSADASSNALTILLKYNLSDRLSIYGGPRVVEADGDITLSGRAYGPLNGNNYSFDSSRGIGYVVGAAYEIPDIAFRASLTYHSNVRLDLNTTITPFGGGPIPVGSTQAKLPESIKLAVQSGVAKDTLVFGSVRWSNWSEFKLDPAGLTPNLAELDDSIIYEIGVGRKFSDKFSASISYAYDHSDGNDLVSPLGPRDGEQSISVGGKYQVTDAINVSGGIKYIWFGDARPETGTPDVARGAFNSNTAIAAGFKVGINF
ncbi:hypothetical protein G5B38_01965 [Pseudohalocynthiibacter aestuariivivens]|nr:outer membrane protein transport protein [Pseudohalocynthiibacter aestuariivivens]QIE44394.1 hypothetical protein G5B38_01965 [Pseudohalocynthiibacter aestuariivivens]